ncbi:endonuclease domain-containing protein [Rhizorhabdus sp. FW153]
MLTGPKRTIERARKLRKALSLPEVLLWKALRQRPRGWKFRRQHPAGPYVLDFYCAEARLAIEVDGIAHDMGDRPERDAVRDAWLAGQGVAVLRIPAGEVLRNADDAVRQIVSVCEARRPLHRPADGPPPRPGEDR